MTDATPPGEPVEPGDRPEPTEPGRSLPPDPEAYDEPRAELARARGLSAPYIPGGRDPEPDEGRRQERFYGRLLLIMVVAILGTTFVLTIAAIALGAFAYGGR